MPLTSLLNTRKRRLSVLLTGITASLLTAAAISAQTPGITGTWQMDPAKSQVTDGRTVTLTIESVANKLKLSSTVRDKAGQEVTAEFICGVDGKECEFNEGAHKSKVAMWYSGPALNVCKTDGPAGDLVDEWKLELSPDGKTLMLTITYIDPSRAAETLIFSKKAS